jgi:hypothetical protein
MESDPNKKKRNQKPLIKKEDKISSLDRAQINELLADSIQNYVIKSKKKTKEIEEIISSIDNYLSEFLQTFMIIGYDMKGQPVCIHHSDTQLDADALNCLINRIMYGRNE